MNVRRVSLFTAMAVLAVVMLYPFWFMLDNAFRSATQFEQGGGHSLEGWRTLFDTIPILRQLANSLLVCAVSIAIILVISTTAGFAFAKLGFRGSTVALTAVIAAMMVPLQSIILPEYVNLSGLHLVGNYTGAILVYAALGTPFATFLMTTYFRGLPDELIEAAVVDGFGYIRIFQRIALPLAKPAIVTVIVLQFIQIWCDLLVGLLFLQDPSQRTITVGLAALAAGRTTSIPALMAGSLVSSVPAIVVYLTFQRRLISGLTLGMGK
ncbi:MAG: carbohydrate transporter rane protein 2, family [Streptosporangiaceae bacterium]|jgi:multiple sugar transport system permease protein/raffinose/stachyose/melibiose transport system permease protein|nr:carbohydrate transporter rane protein 2, family [Streptosporangiaceae bacterium]